MYWAPASPVFPVPHFRELGPASLKVSGMDLQLCGLQVWCWLVSTVLWLYCVVVERQLDLSSVTARLRGWLRFYPLWCALVVAQYWLWIRCSTSWVLAKGHLGVKPRPLSQCQRPDMDASTSSSVQRSERQLLCPACAAELLSSETRHGNHWGMSPNGSKTVRSAWLLLEIYFDKEEDNITGYTSPALDFRGEHHKSRSGGILEASWDYPRRASPTNLIPLGVFPKARGTSCYGESRAIWRVGVVFSVVSLRGRRTERGKRRVIIILPVLREGVVLVGLHCSLALLCGCGAVVGPFVCDCKTERLVEVLPIVVCPGGGTILVVDPWWYLVVVGVKVDLCSVEVCGMMPVLLPYVGRLPMKLVASATSCCNDLSVRLVA
ncbi:hypothetical protein Taro_035052 [Colocasia esculenta]|uniref:Uncharacterized protein n=1 Tax=Colocasia esculenta TaxID=4460 RepID=A0A843W5K4_COLES|nr:hypothetical protein [Colocasia esculenta]